MQWPTWDQAAIAAVLSACIAVLLTRRSRTRAPGPRATFTEAATREFALVAGIYSLWRVARSLPLAQGAGAKERAYQVVDIQHTLHFPTELSLQRWVLQYDTLARVTNLYYATLHVPTLIAFLVWLFVRHRNHYPHWRNGLVLLTAACLVIRFVRVAPPRFLGELGYVDLATRYGFEVYGPVGTGVSDQFAAMPSIHVGWAAVVSFGIVVAGTSRWRWLALGHLIITMIVVSATGNHWWLDGIVSIALLGAALLGDRWARSWLARRRCARAEATDAGDGPAAGNGGAAATDTDPALTSV